MNAQIINITKNNITGDNETYVISNWSNINLNGQNIDISDNTINPTFTINGDANKYAVVVMNMKGAGLNVNLSGSSIFVASCII